MKKTIGINKALEIISISELETWPTRRCLARLKKLRWCYEAVNDANDYTAAELEAVKDKLLFKSDPRWQKAYADVKTVLASREHIDAKI